MSELEARIIASTSAQPVPDEAGCAVEAVSVHTAQGPECVAALESSVARDG